jgi:hypothetical protein
MDTGCHIVQGYLVIAVPVSIISPKAGIILGIISGLAAAVPDVAGEIYAHYLEKDGYKYRMYGLLHERGNLFSRMMSYIPGYYLHIMQDRFLHKPGKRWWIWKERMWYEIIAWVLNIILIWIYLKII